jgi:hypothetical protein
MSPDETALNYLFNGSIFDVCNGAVREYGPIKTGNPRRLSLLLAGVR